MPNESIVFSPEIDERQLDREVGTVNDQLSEVGRDVPVNFDAEELDLPGGVGGGVGGGGGGGGVGAGGAAGAASLASRIPKPVAGVTAAAALPIAIAGSVGLGMLNAMQGASARLQTSTTLLGQAYNDVWKPLGDDLDELFVREAVMELKDATQEFEETYRDGNRGEAIVGLLGDLSTDLGTGLNIPELQLGGTLAKTIEQGMGDLGWGPIIDEWLPDIPKFEWPNLPTFKWPELPTFRWPSLPSFNWPTLPSFDWPTLPTFDRPSLPSFRWPSLPSFRWPSLPTFKWPTLPKFNWPTIPQFNWPEVGMPDWPSTSQLLNRFPTISVGSLRSTILGDETQGGSTSTGPEPAPGQDRGGTERFPGRGESRTPGAPGGSTRRGDQPTGPTRPDQTPGFSEPVPTDTDTSQMEQKLDEVNRNLRRLWRESGFSIDIGDETIARAAESGRTNRISDTDPTV